MNPQYDQELTSLARAGLEEIQDWARTLASAGTAQNMQRIDQLCDILRENNSRRKALELRRIQYGAEPTVIRLTQCFEEAVALGDTQQLRNLSDEARQRMAGPKSNYNSQLFPLWLKAANVLTDEALFDEVYSRIPQWEKDNNRDVLIQYYICLTRRKEYETLCSHYERLPEHLSRSLFLRMRYNMALRQLENGSARDMPSVKGQRAEDRKIFLSYSRPSMYSTVVTSLLRANGIRVVDLAQDIRQGRSAVETFEMQMDKRDYAIVLLEPEYAGTDGLWHPSPDQLFVYGYFMARLGRRNVFVLRLEDGKRLARPTDFASVHQISLDRPDWIRFLNRSLSEADFQVDFG